MKKAVLLFCAILGSVFASDKINDLIAEILKLNGTSKSVIEKVKDPFEKPIVFREGNFTPPPEPVFVLKAIFESSAFINGKWYKTGDKLEGYSIVEIKKHSVVLFDKPKQKKVYLFEGKK